jgi:hypothetical protein
MEGITRFCRCAPTTFEIYLLVWQVAGVQVGTEPLRELGQEKTKVQESFQRSEIGSVMRDGICRGEMHWKEETR